MFLDDAAVFPPFSWTESNKRGTEERRKKGGMLNWPHVQNYIERKLLLFAEGVLPIRTHQFLLQHIRVPTANKCMWFAIPQLKAACPADAVNLARRERLFCV